MSQPTDRVRREMNRVRGTYPKKRQVGTETVRVRPYLPVELVHQLTQRCVTDRITVSAAVTAAVEQWVGGASDRALILRRLDRLGSAIERQHRDAEFHAKAFAIFVHTWLLHTRSVAPQDRAAAMESAKMRYRQIVKQVVDEFSNGSRFIDDLPKEMVADDAELDAILGQSETSKRVGAP